MNFLAHLYLSGKNDGILVGNFIADAVKGKKAILAYPEDVQMGIIMHREIDYFMDTHPLVKKGMSRLREGYPKFSGVIMDIFYDHMLAVKWHQYSDQTLAQFAQSVFHVMDQHVDVLPERIAMMYPYFKGQNWMLSYNTVEGIGEILGRMSRRINRGVPMQGATTELEMYYEEYGIEFEEFFSEIMDYISKTYNISFTSRK